MLQIKVRILLLISHKNSVYSKNSKNLHKSRKKNKEAHGPHRSPEKTVQINKHI